jgi:hypothetical protein
LDLDQFLDQRVEGVIVEAELSLQSALGDPALPAQEFSRLAHRFDEAHAPNSW